MINRNTKRLAIMIIYLIIFGIFGSLIYYALEPDPTCNDKKKNQSEDGIDCGGP